MYFSVLTSKKAPAQSSAKIQSDSPPKPLSWPACLSLFQLADRPLGIYAFPTQFSRYFSIPESG